MDTSTNDLKQEPSTVNIDDDVEMAEVKKKDSEIKPSIETDLANVKIEAEKTEIKSEPNADENNVTEVKESITDDKITDDNKDGIVTHIKTELNPEDVEVKTESDDVDSTSMEATETSQSGDTSTGGADESADLSGAADKSAEEVKDESLNRTMNLDSSDMQQAPVLVPKPKASIFFIMFASYFDFFHIFSS
jgi:hypothetical protein